ncbi:MAG: O-antigen ligase family protein [Erysipelotrichaceae bacterium]|nr:O-antigen ligase family protein [Erysipelotrichaceae bacterium]
MLIVFEIWVFTTTFLNDFIYWPEALYNALLESTSAVSMGLFIELFKDDGEDLVKGLMIDYEIFIYLNFITVLMYAPGGYAGKYYYFIDHRPQFIHYFFPAICLCALYMKQHKKYVRPAVLLSVITFSIFRTWCATIVVAFVAALGFLASSYVLPKIIPVFKKWRMSFLFIMAVLANIFVVFIYAPGRFGFIDYIITDILKKNTTFTGRDRIWEAAKRMIMEKPLIGYGSYARVEVSDTWEPLHAHNEILQRLFITGIIGLILFLIFHYLFIKNVDHKDRDIYLTVILGLVFGIYITYITEAYAWYFRLLPIFFMAYHYEEIVNKAE